MQPPVLSDASLLEQIESLGFGVSFKNYSLKSIRPDLEEKGCTHDIIEEAERIYVEDYNSITKRGDRRSKFVFCIALEAYKNLGKTITPFELLERFKIKKNEITKAKSKNFVLRTVPKCIIKMEKVDNYIKHYLNKLNLNEYYKKIIQYKKMLNLPDTMNNQSPSILALAIIWLYTENATISFFHYSDIFKIGNVTETTVKKMKTFILETLRKPQNTKVDDELMAYLS